MKTRFDYPKSGFDSPKSSYSQTTTTKALRLPAMAKQVVSHVDDDDDDDDESIKFVFALADSGAIADSLSRRSFLIISSMLYFVSGIVMLWSPNIYIFLLARLWDGFGIGIAVTLAYKGQMIEVKKVLQRLRGIEDVAGEMTLLVKGLGVGSDTSIEEYIIGSANELTDKSALGLVSRHGSMANQSGFVDPLVTL
ncbi:hypothetical protein F8388_026260 [Cannabis sativa]|uniref:Uncharacterized protein n=1 Tax=Cannabis sativa TaxID=3483 RepID=A0A7J6E0T2_CANSA|nr:hypothetical protein F8388_026260 [Cannabis sativa]